MDVERETRLEEERKNREKMQADRASDLGQVNKKLFDFASQQGIDHSQYGSALEVAQALAFKRAKANKAFSDLINEDPENDVPYSIITPKYGTDRVRILNDYLKALTAKYLRGEFQ
jgi:predicted Zn-dependent protease